MDDLPELALELLDLGLVGLDDGLATGLIDEDTTHVHLKNRRLKAPRELVDGCGVIIELRQERIEDFEGDAAVKAVVYPQALGRRVRGRGLEQVGADGFHCGITNKDL